MVATKKRGAGRPKSDKTMGVLLALRVDKEFIDRLDQQVKQTKADAPYMAPTRSMVARMLILEALDARQKVKKPK